MQARRDGARHDASAQLYPPTLGCAREPRRSKHGTAHRTAREANRATVRDTRATGSIAILRERNADDLCARAGDDDVIANDDHDDETRTGFDDKTAINEQNSLPYRSSGQDERTSDVHERVIVGARARAPRVAPVERIRAITLACTN